MPPATFQEWSEQVQILNNQRVKLCEVAGRLVDYEWGLHEIAEREAKNWRSKNDQWTWWSAPDDVLQRFYLKKGKDKLNIYLPERADPLSAVDLRRTAIAERELRNSQLPLERQIQTLQRELQLELERLKERPSYQAHLAARQLEELEIQGDFAVTKQKHEDQRRSLVQSLESFARQEKFLEQQINALQMKVDKEPDSSLNRVLRREYWTFNRLGGAKKAELRTLKTRQKDLQVQSRREEYFIAGKLANLTSIEQSEREAELARLGVKLREQKTLKEWADREKQDALEKKMALKNPYQYGTLPAATHFRLLKLQPGQLWSPDSDGQYPLPIDYCEFGGDLVCSLHTFDLLSSECPHFEALSYEWATNQQNSNIHSVPAYILMKEDQKLVSSIKVGRNLADFLKHIRQAQDHIWVWADALCINQQSLDERASQVKLMGRIFGHADRVLTWLPVDSPKDCVRELRLLCWSAQSRSDAEEGPRSSYAHFFATGQGYDRLEHIFGLTYWTRKWIIQEIILARTVILIMGDFQFAMQDLEDSLAELEAAHNQLHSHSTAEVSSWPLARLASHRRLRRLNETRVQMLCELLPMYARHECSIPLDHVYALYNLMGSHREDLPVDYKQDHSSWFLGVFQFLDQHESQSRYTIINSGFLLLKMIHQRDLETMALSPEQLAIQVTATAFDRGPIEIQGDCAYSLRLRDSVNHLHPGLRWTMRESVSLWSVCEKEQSGAEHINRRVLTYFHIPGTQICGLAATRPRLQAGDRVWQFVGSNLAFIVRLSISKSDPSSQEACITGRCYLFSLSNTIQPLLGPDPEPSPSTLALNRVPQYVEETETYDLLLNLLDLFTLARSATDIKFIDGLPADDTASPTKRVRDDGAVS